MVMTSSDEIDRTFDRMERITAVGTALSALESLSRPDMLRRDGLFSWDVARTRSAAWGRAPWRTVLGVFDYPGVSAIHAGRLAAAGALLAGGSRRRRAVCVAGLAGTTWALGLRTNYGADGSDHMAILTYIASTVEKAFADDPRVREACLWFVAGEACLSYTTAGLAKLASPVWRNGQAMTGIFRTRTYGHEWSAAVLKKYPALAVVGCWSVIIAETLFPLVLVLPAEYAWPLLGLGLLFHVGNAHLMGLNRFLWAFSGTYPAVVRLARHLDAGDPARFATLVRSRLATALAAAPVPAPAPVPVAAAATTAGTVAATLRPIALAVARSVAVSLAGSMTRAAVARRAAAVAR
jgi:hypothetical protein